MSAKYTANHMQASRPQSELRHSGGQGAAARQAEFGACAESAAHRPYDDAFVVVVVDSTATRFRRHRVATQRGAQLRRAAAVEYYYLGSKSRNLLSTSGRRQGAHTEQNHNHQRHAPRYEPGTPPFSLFLSSLKLSSRHTQTIHISFGRPRPGTRRCGRPLPLPFDSHSQATHHGDITPRSSIA
jgi:hypothetical protein